MRTGLFRRQRRSDNRDASEAWQRDYNESRPHTSLGWLTPAEYAAAAAAQASNGHRILTLSLDEKPGTLRAYVKVNLCFLSILIRIPIRGLVANARIHRLAVYFETLGQLKFVARVPVLGLRRPSVGSRWNVLDEGKMRRTRNQPPRKGDGLPVSG